MQIKVLSDSLLIQWSDEPIDGSFYTLYKSTSETSDFEPIVLYTSDIFHVDVSVNLNEVGKKYFYKVAVFSDEKELLYESPVATAIYNKPDGVARVVMHESKILLERVMNNPPYQLLVKKRSGMHCPDCYNSVTKRVMYTDCARCAGTGLIGGYHAPIKIFLSKDISNLTSFNSMLDEENIKLSSVEAWTGNFPILKPDDVIVDVLNQRYRITNVSPRMKSHALIRQLLQLVPLEKGHPAYSVEVLHFE